MRVHKVVYRDEDSGVLRGADVTTEGLLTLNGAGKLVVVYGSTDTSPVPEPSPGKG